MTIKPNRNVPRTIRYNLLDKKFGELTVVGFAPRRKTAIRWLCRCSCGTFREASSQRLLNGVTAGCPTCMKKKRRRYGPSQEALRETWRGMKRLQDLCKKWMKFETFLADLGERPEGAWLRRHNKQKPHSPGNSFWETSAEKLERDVELLLAAISPVENEEAARQWLRSISRQRRDQIKEEVEAGLGRCSCGRLQKLASQQLRKGRTARCRKCAMKMKKSGRGGDPMYGAWRSLRRQEILCKKWMKYKTFLADLGERPKKARLRRHNTQKPHSPSNSFWETPQQRHERELELILAALAVVEDEKATRRWLRSLTLSRRCQLLKIAKTGQRIQVHPYRQ